jgi:hypothetical protein
MLDGVTKGVRVDAKPVPRMGDGSCVERTLDELRGDIKDGVRQGASCAKVPAPTDRGSIKTPDAHVAW